MLSWHTKFLVTKSIIIKYAGIVIKNSPLLILLGLFAFSSYSVAQSPGGPADFGDLPNLSVSGAPIIYKTTIADGGPWHLPGTALYLGKAPDTEADGLPTANADGDDATGTPDDEDGVSIPANIKAATSTAFPIDVTNGTPSTAYLHGFVDWNGDGSFVGASEQQVIPVGPGFTGIINMTFNVPPLSKTDTKVGARFRISTQALDPEDPAPNGEVEDYMIQVEPPDRDFGDLPDGSLTITPFYKTTIADGGPSHVLSSLIYLGSVPADNDMDGQPDAMAQGDDTDPEGDDEGGFQPLTTIQAGTTVNFTHNATNQTGGDAWLHVFIDWNSDGDFLDASEYNKQLVPDGSVGALINVSIDVPLGNAYPDPVAARLRLTTWGTIGPDGQGTYGEVEDYYLDVLPAYDFGDLPDSATGTAAGDFSTTPPDYQTRLADDGPYHLIINELVLANDTGSGDADIDHEADGQPTSGADGDDNNDENDELDMLSAVISQAVNVGPGLQPEDVTIDIELALSHAVRNDLTVDANLYTFVDWNNDGDFDDADESFSQVIAAGTNGAVLVTVSETLDWPETTSWSETWAVRTRLTTDTSVGPTGYASDGEVQDDLVSVSFSISDPLPDRDHGDLPDECVGPRAGNFDRGPNIPDYQTLIVDDGPYHIISPDLYIENDSGSADTDVDDETDGQPTSGADGDDNDGNNDDHNLLAAVTSQTFNIATPVEHSTLSIGLATSQAVHNTTGSDATFYVFLDANRDGDFDDAGESDTVVIPGDGSVTSAVSTFNFDIPWNGELNWTETFAVRFRISTDSTLDANGAAPDGEVQDDLISFTIALSNPYSTTPTVVDMPDFYASMGLGATFDASELITEDIGVISNVIWSVNGTVIAGSPPSLSTAELTSLGEGAHPLVVSFDDASGNPYVAYPFLIIADMTEYDAWASAIGLAGDYESPIYDPDGDGHNSFDEFALGSDGNDAGSLPGGQAGFETSGANTWFTYSYLRRSGGIDKGDYYHADGVRYGAEGSSDLSTWDIDPVETTNPSGLPSASAGYEWHTIRLPDTISTTAPGFLRLHISDGCEPYAD